MCYILDRWEGEYAVLLDETEQAVSVLKTALAEDVREGDALLLGEDGIYRKNAEETEERREKIKKMMDTLWE